MSRTDENDSRCVYVRQRTLRTSRRQTTRQLTSPPSHKTSSVRFHNHKAASCKAFWNFKRLVFLLLLPGFSPLKCRWNIVLCLSAFSPAQAFKVQLVVVEAYFMAVLYMRAVRYSKQGCQLLFTSHMRRTEPLSPSLFSTFVCLRHTALVHNLFRTCCAKEGVNL